MQREEYSIVYTCPKCRETYTFTGATSTRVAIQLRGFADSHPCPLGSVCFEIAGSDGKTCDFAQFFVQGTAKAEE